MNDVHVMQATILQHDQHAKYKDCVLWIDSLGKELQSLVKRCDILQGKLENVENEKLEDKDIATVPRLMLIRRLCFGQYQEAFQGLEVD